MENTPTVPPIGNPDLEFHAHRILNAIPLEMEQGLARYKNRQETGRWKHGSVYTAHHPGLDRQVVIRVLDCTKNNNPEIKHEFLQRAKAISKLNHPNTVSAMEAGIDNEVAFIVQEQVDGEPISGFHPRRFGERCREGFFPGEKISKFMHRAASGLQAIHDQGIAHGNLAAETLFVDRNGTLKIIGLTEPTAPQSAIVESDQSIPSVRADIFQLGAAFFKITTGNELQPFVLSYSTEKIVRHIKKQNSGLRLAFCKVIARCVTKQDDAYTSCRHIVSDLAGLTDQQTMRANWRTRTYSLLFGMIAGLFVVVLILIPFFYSEENFFQHSIGFATLILISVAMETIFGFTPSRRLFGLKIYDHSGDEAHWSRRLVRATMRLGIVFSLIVAAAMILTASFNSTPAGLVFSVAVVVAFFPLGILYVPARFIKCRWTYYDLWAGATWGEFVSREQIPEGATNSESIATLPSGVPIDQIDQFKIYKTLGSGGMGNVFLAHDQTLHRNVAIKVLSGHLVGDAETCSRFQREARLAARISHTNVARIFGNGVWNSLPYIVMELVDGSDLHESVEANGAMHVEPAWKCIIQAAEALQVAAKLGVIHRDIKPANLMLNMAGEIKVMDFGISREINSDVNVTQAGSVIGTPTYMSPEQAMGKEIDFRSDIYSLGLTLYFLLAGRAPFEGSNSMQILAQKMDSAPPPLLGQIADLTPDQQAVIDKMIAKNPAERYFDYETLLLELKRNYSGGQRLGRPTKRIAAEVCNITVFFLFAAMSIAMAEMLIGFDSGASSNVANSLMLFFQILFVGMYIRGIGTRGMTSGKNMLGLKVTRSNGQPVGLARAAARFLIAYPVFISYPILPVLSLLGFQFTHLYFIPNLLMALNVVMVIVSFILMIKHPKRQTLHDLAVDTVVLNTQN